MARIRQIKPDFFRSEDVANLEPIARLLFIGLWTLADREGRLPDRPRRIAIELFPYDRMDERIDLLLGSLAARGLIARYARAGFACIQITGFGKHQKPHPKEPASELPPPPLECECVAEETGVAHLDIQSRGETRPATDVVTGENVSQPPGRSGSGSLGSGSLGSGELSPRSETAKPSAEPGPTVLAAPPQLPSGRVNGHGLAQMFGIVRAREVTGAIPWHVPKDRTNKADAIADAIADDPAARADVIPSMVLFFQRAKAGEIGQGGKAVSDPSYGFACWVSAFTALREALSGKGPVSPPEARPASAGPKAPFYPILKPIPAGVAPPPRPRP